MGLIGSIFQGIFGSNAANHAADVQANASDHAADLEKQAADQSLAFNKLQYGNALNLMSPYYNMGTSAMGRLGFLMGLRPSQGLPPGVTDPNAPPAPASPALDGSAFDPNTLAQLRALRNGGNGGPRVGIPQAAGMINPSTGTASSNVFQNNPTLPTGNPGTAPFNMTTNTPITSPGTQQNPYQMTMNTPITSGGAPSAATGGKTGMLQTDANGNPIGTTSDVNPMQGTNLGTVTPQSATNATGAPGTVPQTGGGTGSGAFSFNGPITPNIPQGEGGFGFPGQGSTTGSNGGSGTDPGGFGSLAQSFGEQWKAPTGVTEVNDPGYQFRINQGLQALQNSAAARGKLVSGDTAKGLNDYAQNSASGEFQNVYNRALNDYTTRYNAFNNDQNTLFNRFATLSGLGQTSAGQLANVGLSTAGNNSNILLNSAGQIGQDVQNAGAARGSGYVGSANAINGAIGSGTNNIMQLLALMGGM